MRFSRRPVPRMLLGLMLVVGGFSLVFPALGADRPSFEVHMGEGGETLGDLRPAYIDLKTQALPHVSINEVARRYEQLFRTATDPDVRIDALHRLLNLQSIPGTHINLSPEQEKVLYRKALKSYQMILDSGVYYGRLDELLYQMARAYSFVGEDHESDERLEQLVGLYPRSRFAVEAWFRIGEYKFSQGQYKGAVKAYRTVLGKGPKTAFADKARYMLGWSQYKDGSVDAASLTFISVLDRYYAQSDGFRSLGRIETETVQDTFRILSIIAAYSGGARELNALLSKTGDKPYTYLLYDRLADFYFSQQRYADSVAVDKAYLARFPDRPKAPAIAAQIVATYSAGDFTDLARKAKVAFVKRYGNPSAKASLDSEEQGDLYDYLRDLGHWSYRQGQQATDSGSRKRWFARAGAYLSRLADLYPADVTVGPTELLAGDAFRQAGNLSGALRLYQRAAYHSPDFDRAADAGYAAVLVRRQQWRQAKNKSALENLAAESRRFTTIFSDDDRANAVRVHVANLLYDQGDARRAGDFADIVVHSQKASTEQKRSAWLVLANGDYDAAHYQRAEHGYRQARQLSPPKPLADRIREKLGETVYQEARKAEAAGQVAVAVANYRRVATVAPDSRIVAKAQFDGASLLLKARRWHAAINELQRFRQSFPKNPLNQRIPEKLVYAYQQSHQPGLAADELMAWAESGSVGSRQHWPRELDAAELYDQAGATGKANAIYRDYLAHGPTPESSRAHVFKQQLRMRLAKAGSARAKSGNANRWYRAIVHHELHSQLGSDDSAAIASQAALALAGQAKNTFDHIRLILPLKRSLARKKAALEKAVRAYRTVEKFGVADGVTEATFALGELYRQLSVDLQRSQRPKGLNSKELDQYNMLLQEQAFPFENKAIAFYRQNQKRMPQGIYNQWVSRSLKALAKLYPARYARTDQWMGWVDAAP